MRLPIIKLLILTVLLWAGFSISPGQALANHIPAGLPELAHGMSPRDGHITTATGAPIAGVTVVEYTDWCPPASQVQQWMPGCPYPTNCHNERSTTTDQNGYFYFAPGPPQSASNPCDLNVWWRYTCSNPEVFYKIVPTPAQRVLGLQLISAANAQSQSPSPSPSGSGDPLCPPVQHPTTNVTSTLTKDMTCVPPPVACNALCQNSSQCAFATGGCTACIEGVCKTPPVCNTACERDGQCEGAKNGCTSCLPSDDGTGKVCRPPAACNVSCTRDDQCAGATRDGCTLCINNVCAKPPACNDSCTNAADCAKSVDGCTSCIPNNTGTGNVCAKPPACNSDCVRDDQCVGDAARDGCNVCSGGKCKAPACGIACTKDGQCAAAKDGCTVCMGGICKPPPSCGTACATKADCANPKDGCSECLEGTCTDFNDNMCKCDGITADLTYPSSAFKFEAFGKVEGADTKKAEIADITFRLTKDNQVIAKSNPITPQVVENSANKLRFKAAWQTPPPPVSKTSTYRVFADVRCKPKKIIASVNDSASQNRQALSSLSEVKLLPPKGLKLAFDLINRLSWNNQQVKSITAQVLALFSASTVNAQDANLQLRTLNFVKMMSTDNCRFVMFKFDETLF